MSTANAAAMAARYDDEAWAALASRGLLRRARKDLPAAGVRVTAETGDDVEIAVGDRTVRIGPAGPASAACSCPSPVICQHIITAGLWLAGTAGDSPAPAAPGGTAPDSGHLHEELMAQGADALTAHAGLPAYRRAHQFLQDQREPPAVTRDGYLSVTFDWPPVTVRYLGGGLDGLVLDQDVPHPERVRVAAVLAWQRAHGLELPAPPAPPRRPGARRGETEAARGESRARLRASTASLLRDLAAVGVSHLSPAMTERLTAAATWAQGVDYHRLARALRRLADHADLGLARSAAADDLALIDELAAARALVSALEAAARTGPEPVALAGQARAAYDPLRSLDLVGLGGRPWRSASGYHGLTCLFWSPALRQFLTLTESRPESLPGFDPRARWRQPGPWTGLRAPAAATGQRVTLTGARISAGNRLSSSEATAAVTMTPLSGGDLAGLLPAAGSWRDVAPPRVRSLTDPEERDPGWTVLRPARALPPEWDEAAQELRCPLADADGEPLTLDVPWSRANAHAIGRLEALGGNLPAGTLVVARVSRRRGRLTGEPLSLILPGREDGPVDALHFDEGPGQGPSPLVERLTRSGAPERPAPGDGPAAVPAALAALRGLLEAEAQRGCDGAPPGVLRDRVAAACRDLRHAGLTVFGDPDPALSPPDLLLRSLYLVQQVEQALQ